MTVQYSVAGAATQGVNADASGWAKTEYLSGAVTVGDVFTVTLRKTSDSSTKSYSYTAASTLLDDVLVGLSTAINGDSTHPYAAQEVPRPWHLVHIGCTLWHVALRHDGHISPGRNSTVRPASPQEPRPAE